MVVQRWGSESSCTSLNFNVKVYRFELPQATTIESSASVSCGGWMSVGGMEECFLGGKAWVGMHGFIGGRYCPYITWGLKGKYNQNKRGSTTPTTCICIWQNYFTSFGQILFISYNYCKKKNVWKMEVGFYFSFYQTITLSTYRRYACGTLD